MGALYQLFGCRPIHSSSFLSDARTSAAMGSLNRRWRLARRTKRLAVKGVGRDRRGHRRSYIGRQLTAEATGATRSDSWHQANEEAARAPCHGRRDISTSWARRTSLAPPRAL